MVKRGEKTPRLMAAKKCRVLQIFLYGKSTWSVEKTGAWFFAKGSQGWVKELSAFVRKDAWRPAWKLV